MKEKPIWAKNCIRSRVAPMPRGWTKWRAKPCSICGLSDSAGVLPDSLVDWGHVGSSF